MAIMPSDVCLLYIDVTLVFLFCLVLQLWDDFTNVSYTLVTVSLPPSLSVVCETTHRSVVTYQQEMAQTHDAAQLKNG